MRMADCRLLIEDWGMDGGREGGYGRGGALVRRRLY